MSRTYQTLNPFEDFSYLQRERDRLLGQYDLYRSIWASWRYVGISRDVYTSVSDERKETVERLSDKALWMLLEVLGHRE